jgi:hypothetical protein
MKSHAKIPDAPDVRNCRQVWRRPARRWPQAGRGKDPADGAFTDPMPEAEQFTPDATVPHRGGFSRANRITNSRSSCGTGRRPSMFG